MEDKRQEYYRYLGRSELAWQQFPQSLDRYPTFFMLVTLPEAKPDPGVVRRPPAKVRCIEAMQQGL